MTDNRDQTHALLRTYDQQAFSNWLASDIPVNPFDDVVLLPTADSAWRFIGIFQIPDGTYGTRDNRAYLTLLDYNSGVRIDDWPGNAFRGRNHYEDKTPIEKIDESPIDTRFNLPPESDDPAEVALFDIKMILEGASSDELSIVCHEDSRLYVVFVQTTSAPSKPPPVVEPPPIEPPPTPPPGEAMSWHTQYYERAVDIFQQGLPPDIAVPYIHDTSPAHQFLFVPVDQVAPLDLHPEHVFIPIEVGQQYFKLLVYHKLTAAENIGMHNIFADVIDLNGNRLTSYSFRSWWGEPYSTVPYSNAPHLQIVVDKPLSEPGTNLPMGEAYYSLIGEHTSTGEFLSSDLVYNLTVAIGDDPGPPHPAPGQGNTRGHHSYYCVFGLSTWTGEVEPPPVQPPVTPPPSAIIGTLAISREEIDEYFRLNPGATEYRGAISNLIEE